LRYIVNGTEVDLDSASGVEIERLGDKLIVRTADGVASAVVRSDGKRTLVSYKGSVYEICKAGTTTSGSSTSGATSGKLISPMPGMVVDLLVADGDTVETGQRLLVLEAMKMQLPLTAPFAGTVQVKVAKGDQLTEGQLLAEVIAPAE
jgi:biotin carboxyl carrier protein